MSKSESITININSEELTSFCLKLLKRSRDISKTHDALITLESFISIFSRPSHGTREYQHIEDAIKSITADSRKKLLEQNTNDLIGALRQCDLASITTVHGPLSRNGFYQILQVAIDALTDDEIRVLIHWVGHWVSEARQLAEAASGYPDAMDFKAAGISIDEYQAMADIHKVLCP